MLAKNSRAAREIRQHALPLTFFASTLAPTGVARGLLARDVLAQFHRILLLFLFRDRATHLDVDRFYRQ